MRPKRQLDGQTIQALFEQRDALRRQLNACDRVSEQQAFEAALRQVQAQLADQVDSFYDLDHVGPADLANTVKNPTPADRCAECAGALIATKGAPELHAEAGRFFMREAPITLLTCERCGQEDSTRRDHRLIQDRAISTEAAALMAEALFLEEAEMSVLVRRIKGTGHPLQADAIWRQLDALYAALLPHYMSLKDRLLEGPRLHLQRVSWRGDRRRRAPHTLWRLSGEAGVFYQLGDAGDAGVQRVCEDYDGLLIAHDHAVSVLLEAPTERPWACTPNVLIRAFRRSRRDKRVKQVIKLLTQSGPAPLEALFTLCEPPSTDAVFNEARAQLHTLRDALTRGLHQRRLSPINKPVGHSDRRRQVAALMCSLLESAQLRGEPPAHAIVTACLPR